jgi:hypothetical protein
MPEAAKAKDPTENVREVILAQEKLRDALRMADLKYADAMSAAETRRIDELAAQKLTFDLELAKILRANQDAAATLLATQLKEVKNDLSDRTAKLEQFRWETGGRTFATGESRQDRTTDKSQLIAVVSVLIALASFAFVVLHGK